MAGEKGIGNQYIQFVKVLYCKPLTNSKQLPALPIEVRLGFKLQSQRWEASVLPLGILGSTTLKNLVISCILQRKQAANLSEKNSETETKSYIEGDYTLIFYETCYYYAFTTHF